MKKQMFLLPRSLLDDPLINAQHLGMLPYHCLWMELHAQNAIAFHCLGHVVGCLRHDSHPWGGLLYALMMCGVNLRLCTEDGIKLRPFVD